MMTVRVKRWPDGRVPVLKLARALPDGYGEVWWTRQLTEASIRKFVGGMSRLVETPTAPVDVLFVLMNVMVEDVIRTTHTDVSLNMRHERWLAVNVVVGWMVEHAPRTLRELVVDLPHGNAMDIHANVYIRFCTWHGTFWGPLKEELLDRRLGWRRMPSEQRLSAAEEFFASPRGNLALADGLLRGREGLDEERRLAGTFNKVIERLVDRPTDDDVQDVLAALVERDAVGRPLGWYLARDGRRLMMDHRGLRRLVVKTLRLRYVTVKRPDGTTKRTYRRPKEPEKTTLYARVADGRALIDALPAEPLKAEEIRAGRERVEALRALRRAVEDDPLGKAEYYGRGYGMSDAEAGERTGLSARKVAAARRSERLRKKYDRFADVLSA